MNRRQQLPWLLIMVLFILSGCGEGVINTQPPSVAIPEDFKEISVQENAITLSWSPVENADSYRIYYTTNAIANPYEGDFLPIDSPTITYKHSSLAANTKYRYVITAIVNNTESDYSSPVLEVVTLGVPPNVPQNVKVESLDQAVEITWLMKQGETYNLYWDTQGSISRETGKQILKVTSPYSHNQDDSGAPLVNGTTYYYLMEAVNEYGTSNPSNRSSAKPRGQNAPIAPANFTLEPLNGQIRLTWDSSPGAIAYKIYWSTVENIDISTHQADRIITVTDTEYLHTDLVNNRTFYYVITAVATETIESNPSDVQSAMPVATAIPTPPYDVVATPGDTQVIISWKGPAAATYTLYWSTQPNVSSKSPNIITDVTSPFKHGPVANDVTYYYVLTATVAGGTSRDSELDSTMPYEGAVSRPDPPTNFKAVPGDGFIKLEWDRAVGADSYSIYWSLAPNFIINQQTNVIVIGAREHFHLQLINGTTYYYRLSALNEGGESDHSEEISASPRASTTTGDALRGGRLYAQWWEENGVFPPRTDHELWQDRAKFIGQYINQKSGVITWSCQACHGWDYKGATGNYGPMSRDYTGFPGLTLAAQNKTIDEISAFIRAGETSGGKSHAFADVLSEVDIGDLALFIKETVYDPGYSWSGDISNGESIYKTPAADNQGADCDASGCHAGDSETVANVALYDADRFLHIVRFGLSGVMMGGLDLNEAKDVLAYVWKSLVVGNVENNFTVGDLQSFGSAADIAHGGSLYDRWWTLIDYDNQAAAGQPPVPQGGHPLWTTPNATIAGAETWRCKECHGWDYRGMDGQYGIGNHFSGVKGIIPSDANPTMKYNGANQLYEFLRLGGEDGLHAYSPLLEDKYIYQLVQFVETIRKEAAQGQAPHNLINEQTGEPLSYDLALGKSHYEDNDMGRCGRSSCHKRDGTRLAFQDLDPDRGEIQFVDTIAKLNPWEFLHKTRYGFVQPSDVRRMKGVIEYIPEEIKTIESSINILAYSQTDLLPNIKRGGRLYDTWWKENGRDEPVGEHPLWPTSNTTQGIVTWRCSSCHGWDYKGNQGVLADATHPLFTDISGVLDLTIAPENIADFLLDGTVNNPSDHAFASDMKRQDISDLSAFLSNSEQQGVTDIQAAIEAGEAQLGQDIYHDVTPGNCINCHGAQGTSISNVDVGEVAVQAPHQLAHTVRFGQPGSLMVPSITGFTGLSSEEAGHVLIFAETLSGGSVMPPVEPPPPGTTPTYSYATANVERGGRLYEAWWMEMQTSDASVQPPDRANPFWDKRDKLNIEDPANVVEDTWRCITCHAWNYKGIDFHPTDPDVDNLIEKLQLRQEQLPNPEELQEFIYNWIKNGSQGFHNFGSANSGLPTILGERELWDLTRFVIEGTLNTAKYIYATTGELVPLFKANNGKALYEGQKEPSVDCLSCHGADGRTLPSDAVQTELDIFAVAKQDPWRFLHKVRFSQPGSSMPAIIGIGVLNETDVIDITGYAQKAFDLRGLSP